MNPASDAQTNHSVPPGVVNQAELGTQIGQALRATVFSSGLNIAPRRVNEYAGQMAEHFASFAQNDDAAHAATFGETLATEGMSIRSVLAMTEAVRVTNAGDLARLAGSFSNALIEGFVNRHAALLLQQQEQTHRAFLAALEDGSVLPRRHSSA